MKKILLVCAAMIAVAFSASAQDTVNTKSCPLSFDFDSHELYKGVALKVDKEKCKVGLIDTTGRWIVPPIYDDMGYESEGLRQVAKDSLWGFIDTLGNVVIPLQFESEGYFSQGLALACVNGKCGYIDKTGTFVIQPKYYHGWEFNKDGIAIVFLHEYSDDDPNERFCIDKYGNEFHCDR